MATQYGKPVTDDESHNIVDRIVKTKSKEYILEKAVKLNLLSLHFHFLYNCFVKWEQNFSCFFVTESQY